MTAMPTPGVMIIEDEPIVALHLHTQLVSLGYDVRDMFRSGRDALERFSSIDPDVVLMDIRIDGDIDGIETAARIAENSSTAVIYLTASTEEETLERARRTRPFGYLVKPCSERELHATIQVALQRRDDERALRQSEDRLRLALDAAGMGCWEYDPIDSRFIGDRQTRRIIGCDEELALEESDAQFERLVHPDDVEALKASLVDIQDARHLRQLQFRGLPGAREVRWFRAQAKAFRNIGTDGRHRLIGVVQDITDERAHDARLREAASVFNATTEGILLLDDDLRITAANPGYCRLTGLKEDDVVGRRPTLLHGEGTPVTTRRQALAELNAKDRWQGELHGRHRQGSRFVVRVDLAVVRNGRHEFLHHVAVLTDITHLRATEEKLRHLAHHDSLTGLATRVLVRDRLHHAIERSRRHGYLVAVLVADIDHFKTINDSYGHGVGDDLLQVIAQRLASGTREQDTVARQGGDEFMIVLEDIRQASDIADIASKLVNLVGRPLVAGGIELTVSISVGISVFPHDACDGEELIRSADLALYTTKDNGRNGFSFHSPEMRDRLQQRLSSEQDLRAAMANHELQLYFQPQVEVATGRIVGVEALLRRQLPGGALIGPECIIPMAEQSGLIIEIGDWIIHEVCRQAVIWEAAGAPKIRIGINVSVRQLQHNGLLHTFSRLREQFPRIHEYIELEITESALQTGDRSRLAMQALHATGLRFAIDDFGVGYSSLGSLKHLPLQRLKIDKSLLLEIPGNADDVAILEAIMAMAKRLDLRLIAEGVERQDQHDFLRSHRCEEAQGYHYARPMPADTFLQWLLDGDRVAEAALLCADPGG